MEISGRVALVTGGATRVGRALSLALASAGADVFVHYNSSAGPAEEAVAAVEGLGRRAASGAANLSDPTTTPGLISAATEALGPVSILVNSASATSKIPSLLLTGLAGVLLRDRVVKSS